MERTLLLSQSYEPIATISWKRAIVLSVLEKVEVLEEYDIPVRSPSTTVNRPAVVRLLNSFRRYRRRIKFSKHNVFARDGHRCQYCGKRKQIQELTCDHVMPRSRGGKTDWANIVTSCRYCNGKKADRTPEEAGMFPETVPKRPDWVPSFSMRMRSANIPEIWKAYCWEKR